MGDLRSHQVQARLRLTNALRHSPALQNPSRTASRWRGHTIAILKPHQLLEVGEQRRSPDAHRIITLTWTGGVPQEPAASTFTAVDTSQLPPATSAVEQSSASMPASTAPTPVKTETIRPEKSAADATAEQATPQITSSNAAFQAKLHKKKRTHKKRSTKPSPLKPTPRQLTSPPVRQHDHLGSPRAVHNLDNHAASHRQRGDQ